MHISEFFYIPKSDRSVLLVLLLVGAVACVCIYGFATSDADSPSASAVAEPTAQARTSQLKSQAEGEALPEMRKAELFTFDPNTADSSQLRRLGLPAFMVRNIYRYRAHGGVYSRPIDFARTYGLTKQQYRRLEPYIRIADDFRPASELVPRGGEGRYPAYASSAAATYPSAADGSAEGESSSATLSRAGYPVKLKAGEHVVLNQADTTALRQVPGIGSYYARRIANYGQQLGGYVDARQLLEIEGFPEEALPFFQVASAEVRRMNVNTLTLSQLRRHPYLNFYQARAIVDYRRLKGPLRSLDDLRLLPEFPPEAIARLQPYVEF